ncbi:MAG: protein kinase [Myxococcota bacterium]
MGPAQDLSNVTLDGRYRLTRLLGAGGMGQVYEGMHELLDRKVAIKVLLPRYAYEVKFRERFLREAKAASKVRHPNVVQILDFGDTPNGSVYFAMEFLEGRDLQTILRQEGRFTWPRARHMLMQIASALGAAHEHKIIHRDIKPANFFVINARGHREFIKVLDFGIAKITSDPNEADSSVPSLTGTGEVFGTAKYMAPEQAYGYSDDPRVDIYSVGVVAYQMLTGQVPFTGVSTFDIISRHVTAQPQPPRELNPEIPPGVEAVILRALAKQQEDRFGSMDEMEQVLASIPATTGVPTRTLHYAGPPITPAGTPVAQPEAPRASPPATAQAPATPVSPSAARLPPPAAFTPPAAASIEDNLMALQPTAPGESATPGPSSPGVQPRPRPTSDAATAASIGPKHSEPPAPGPRTRVIPTRLRTPSTVTSGELEHSARGSTLPPSSSSPNATVAATPAATPAAILAATSAEAELVGSRASGPSLTVDEPSADGSSASHMHYPSDDGGVTFPVGTGMAGARASETDALVALGQPPKSPAAKRGIVVGLLGTMGLGGLLAAGLWSLNYSDDPPGATAPVVDGSRPVDSPSAEQPRIIIAKRPEPDPSKSDRPTVADPPPVSGPDGGSASPDTPAASTRSDSTRSDPGPAVSPDPSPAPTPTGTDEPSSPAASPASSASKPSGKRASSPSEPAPLTDKRVRWRLARKLKKKCKSKASDPVTIELLVGSTGTVLTKDMPGVSSNLRSCLTAGLAGAQFPEGRARKISVTVDF